MNKNTKPLLLTVDQRQAVDAVIADPNAEPSVVTTFKEMSAAHDEAQRLEAELERKHASKRAFSY